MKMISCLSNQKVRGTNLLLLRNGPEHCNFKVKSFRAERMQKNNKRSDDDKTKN